MIDKNDQANKSTDKLPSGFSQTMARVFKGVPDVIIKIIMTLILIFILTGCFVGAYSLLLQCQGKVDFFEMFKNTFPEWFSAQ